MENAYIKVDIAPLAKPGPSGMDQINFLFAPNKGSGFKPLKDIASGGEISRLTLCIKSLVANAMTLPTLIFDEIDTGVSGEVASRMGEILSDLADKHQVISITHSPQIAAKADRHFFVHKNYSSSFDFRIGDKTFVSSTIFSSPIEFSGTAISFVLGRSSIDFSPK